MERVEPLWPGKYLADDMEEAGMTRKQLAAKLDVSLNWVHKFLHGETPLTPRLSKALDTAFPHLPPGSWADLQDRFSRAVNGRVATG